MCLNAWSATYVKSFQGSATDATKTVWFLRMFYNDCLNNPTSPFGKIPKKNIFFHLLSIPTIASRNKRLCQLIAQAMTCAARIETRFFT